MTLSPIKHGSILLTGGELAVELGGDANARVAAMLLEHSQDRRSALGRARQAEEERLYAMEEQQVEAMRDEAEHVRAAATSRAIGSIVSGGFQIAGGVAMVDSRSEQETQVAAKFSGGAADLSEGFAGLNAAAEDYAAGNARANATSAENRGKASERRLADINDEARDVRELAKTALQFLRDVTEQEGQIELAALFRA